MRGSHLRRPRPTVSPHVMSDYGLHVLLLVHTTAASKRHRCAVSLWGSPFPWLAACLRAYAWAWPSPTSGSAIDRRVLAPAQRPPSHGPGPPIICQVLWSCSLLCQAGSQGQSHLRLQVHCALLDIACSLLPLFAWCICVRLSLPTTHQTLSYLVATCAWWQRWRSSVCMCCFPCVAGGEIEGAGSATEADAGWPQATAPGPTLQKINKTHANLLCPTFGRHGSSYPTLPNVHDDHEAPWAPAHRVGPHGLLPCAAWLAFYCSPSRLAPPYLLAFSPRPHAATTFWKRACVGDSTDKKQQP